jgi:flagellar biosynthetic protein FlhB
MVTASVVPILAVAVVMAIAGGLLQSGFTLAPLALKPKFSHLNPSKGLQRFKPSTMWWEGARATLKLGLLALVVYGPINEARNRMGEAQGLGWWLDFLGDQAYAILLRAAILAVTIAAVDFAFNKRKHIKQMKMSKQEVKQEHKDMEGDPHIKGARRRRAQEMSRNRMISNVATADVVITNPTHYAVALKYQMGEPAPRVVAKGMGRMALKIRKEAYRNGVLVKQDPPLARAIYRTCKVGASVPSALYEAVAVVLAAAFRLRRRRAA